MYEKCVNHYFYFCVFFETFTRAYAGHETTAANAFYVRWCADMPAISRAVTPSTIVWLTLSLVVQAAVLPAT